MRAYENAVLTFRHTPCTMPMSSRVESSSEFAVQTTESKINRGLVLDKLLLLFLALPWTRNSHRIG
jgi:hypothetical protein